MPNDLVEALRLHAFDDCGGKDLPTHIGNIAADTIERHTDALTFILEHARKLRKGTDDWFDLVEFEAAAYDALRSQDKGEG